MSCCSLPPAEQEIDLELAIGERAHGGSATLHAREGVENLRGDRFADRNAAAKKRRIAWMIFSTALPAL